MVAYKFKYLSIDHEKIFTEFKLNDILTYCEKIDNIFKTYDTNLKTRIINTADTHLYNTYNLTKL